MKMSVKLRIFFVLVALIVLGQISACKPESSEDIPTPPTELKNVSPTPAKIQPSPTKTPPPTVTPSPIPAQSEQDIKVKGLYLTGWTAGSKEKMDQFIQLVNETELNTLVIDIKNDDGVVSYASNVSAVQEAGTYIKKYDPDALIQRLHENDIYVIGRLVCFRDPAYSKKNPDLGVKNKSGGLWVEENNDKGITWLNPYDKRNWSYIIDIAKEAVEKGFDEIQFDYIRFPDGNLSKMDFGATGFVKHEVINEFLSFARSEMPDVTLSADIFGIVCVSPEDRENIGQYLELVGRELDYISPMTYPALYARGQIVNKIKFPAPDLAPYEVVYNTLLVARERLSGVEGYRADMRPFIQAFTASWLPEGTFQKYEAEQYRQQIQAVYDVGYEQWIFWDANNRYDATAFELN